ncbi:unnamed protein product [Effrenium voratum]|uniref:Uncharacterized protein n=1 Tax=Effrenium voratum TaxID=2562239 RepID=A0AA36JNC7_9DINO|nr:unnamed protein product [Effrenium voratum]
MNRVEMQEELKAQGEPVEPGTVNQLKSQLVTARKSVETPMGAAEVQEPCRTRWRRPWTRRRSRTRWRPDKVKTPVDAAQEQDKVETSVDASETQKQDKVDARGRGG